MDKINSLYLETKVEKKIALEPYELNNDILYNIRNKITLLENKCYRFGYLQKALNILEYKHGIIHPEDLMCRVVYSVVFGCLICDPQINTVIITQIRNIDDTLISSEAGPVQVLTQPNKLPKNIKIVENSLIFTDDNGDEKSLVKGDSIKIRILNKKYNENDTIIKAIGNIIGIPTEEEIQKNT